MTRRVLVLVCVLGLVGTALGQETDVTYSTTTTTTVSGGTDLLSQLWLMEDATPLDPGVFDLRFGFNWVTESAPANFGDSDDDYVFTPTIVWGVVEDLELSLSVPIWIGDGGDVGPFGEGNYNTTVGMLWRIVEQSSLCPESGCTPLPSVALSTSIRFPTGCDSSGVDGELRLILTTEYESGVRSHFNVFGQTVNNNDEYDEAGLRDFQYGFVLGMDGPLCADGDVRWVADYMNRSSEHDGFSNMNLLELGWEWTMSEMHKLGMSMQIGLDHTGDTPNFGVGLMYALSLGAS